MGETATVVVDSSVILTIEARKGIPKNLSSQVLGEVRVNFLC